MRYDAEADERRRSVEALILDGRTNTEIAEIMECDLRQVDRYRQRLAASISAEAHTKPTPRRA